jgi:NTE family protein
MAGVALVLGAGGTVGHAFHAGVLTALADELGWDARRADLVVGTSAGSIVASMLRAGMPPADMVRRGSRLPLSPEGEAVVRRAGLGGPRARPSRQRATGAMASPALLRRAARAPWAVTPGSLAAALLPEGRTPTEDIAAPFDNLFGTVWPDAATWIVAVQLDTGRRVSFGRPGEPAATPSEAVRASCAIPAFFAPVTIGGERYVDGGVHSTTNADLVATSAGGPPDLVLVSAPMSAARRAVRPGPLSAMRQIARLSLAREVAGLRARGIPVVAFQPTAGDVAVMAGDSLDPAKFAPVAASAEASTRRRLARDDVRERLARLR